MIAVMLLMFVAGIALTQAVSDPKQVTLRWLRLGGIIALTLLAIAATVLLMSDRRLGLAPWGVVAGAVALVVGQLTAVQLAWRQVQRVLAALSFVLAIQAATMMAGELSPAPASAGAPAWLLASRPMLGASIMIGAGLVGGFLMTMLLGHAYLTAGGQMTQAPFQRLVVLLGALMALRMMSSIVLGLLPYLNGHGDGGGAGGGYVWNMAMITARYAVGLVVPAIFLYMIHDCVRRRANQSATGILYVAAVLVIVGEGAALALINATGYVF